MSKVGILLLGFGGPDSLEAVGPFMCNLMGREPSDELVTRVCARYEAIGGSSPLAEIAGRIARALEERLAGAGHDVAVRIGMRYWDPFISDALTDLKDAGCERVIGVSLSPFESKVSSGAYREAVAEAIDAIGGMTYVEAPIAGEMPEFAEFLADSAKDALEHVGDGRIVIAFTAHSLPTSDLVDNDPYPAGLQRVADTIAGAMGLDAGREAAGETLFDSFASFGAESGPTPWFMAYQSKGARPGGWLEPDVDELIDQAAEAGFDAIVVCPIGFITDHMETLYDLDIVAAERAERAGIRFARAAVPNDAPNLVEALGRSISQLL